MRKLISVLVLSAYLPLFAGTGQTNDMGLMYLLILSVLGLILLILNGFDYLSRNRKRIINKIKKGYFLIFRYFEIRRSQVIPR